MGRYLDKCLEARNSIDTDELASLPLGELVGEPSSKFEFRQLGKLTVNSINVFSGLKLPTQYRTASLSKIVREIAFIDVGAEYTPALLGKVPSYMTYVSVEGSSITGILSEDLSEGGQLRVRGRSASQRVRAMLAAPYTDVGPADHEQVLNTEVCDRTVAFSVGRRERLLDFTPSPIDPEVMRDSLDYQASLNTASRAMFDLVINLPLDSQLGRDMQAHAARYDLAGAN
jgi:hypothetical protein